jgi:general secretion pathway protein D
VGAAASRCVARLALAAALFSAGAAGAQTRVYGLEHQAQGPYERVLVFADGPLSPTFDQHAKGSAELVLEGAVLDPSAPRRLSLPADASFLEVSAREQRGAAPRVVIAVKLAPGLTPRMVQRGSQLALELPRRQGEGTGGLDLGGRDLPLRTVVERISRFTQTPVMFDESLQGFVSIVAQRPFTSGEALMLLDTLLLTRGFAAMPSPGGVRKIVRIEGSPWPFVSDLAAATGDEVVTTLITLHTVQVDAVLQALRPQLGKSTLASSFPPTNSLILAGSAALIARIEDIVRALDATGAERLFLRRLRFADAEDTADQLQSAFGKKGLVGAWPDERTNTVAVRAKEEAVAEIRDFLARLDRPAPSQGDLHVMPVQYADPEQLAEIVRALQSGDTARIAAARGGHAGSIDPVSGAQTLVGRSFGVVVDKPTHSLVVQADADTARVLAEVVAELDRIPRQVDVEVTVMELATSSGVDLAFDYFLPLTSPNAIDDPIAFVSGMPSGSASALFDGTPVEQTFAPLVGLPPVDKSLLARFTREPILVPVVVNGNVVPVAVPRESAAITAQDKDIYTRLVMRPRLRLISGEEDEIFVGDNVPIITEQASTTAADPLATRQSVQRQDVGVDLRVKPTLGEAGGIVLDLKLDVSALAPSQSASSASQGPAIVERTLTSTVRLESDRVAAIGWYAGPGRARMNTGTPWLQDIPILGWLFRASQDMTLKNYVLITVAAWRDDPEVHALAEAMRRELARSMGSAPNPLPEPAAPAPGASQAAPPAPAPGMPSEASQAGPASRPRSMATLDAVPATRQQRASTVTAAGPSTGQPLRGSSRWP